jgi:hypothetical protein
MLKLITAAVAGAYVAFAGWASFAPATVAPAACHAPNLPSGDAISVSAVGAASAPAAGGTEYVCTDGTWVHVTSYGN